MKKLIMAVMATALLSCEPEQPINNGDVLKIELTAPGYWSADLPYDATPPIFFNNQYTYVIEGLNGDFNIASQIYCADTVNNCPASTSNIRVYLNDVLMLDSNYTHVPTGPGAPIAGIIIDRQGSNLTFY